MWIGNTGNRRIIFHTWLPTRQASKCAKTRSRGVSESLKFFYFSPPIIDTTPP